MVIGDQQYHPSLVKIDNMSREAECVEYVGDNGSYMYHMTSIISSIASHPP